MCQKCLYKILLEVSSEEKQSLQLISFVYSAKMTHTCSICLIELSQEQKPLKVLDIKLSTVYFSIMLVQLRRMYLSINYLKPTSLFEPKWQTVFGMILHRYFLQFI